MTRVRVRVSAVAAVLIMLPLAASAAPPEWTVTHAGTEDPLTGVTIFMHEAGTFLITGSDGRFAPPRFGAADILVASKEGFHESYAYVDATTSASQIELRPIEDVTARTDHVSRSFRLPAAPIRSPIAPQVADAELPFLVADHAIRAAAKITWSRDIVAEVSLHRADGSGGISTVTRSPALLELPSRLIQTHPGAYALTFRIAELANDEIDLDVALDVEYGVLTSKTVEGMPPQVSDPDMDTQNILRQENMDIRAVSFAYETESTLQMRFDLVAWDNQAAAPGYGIWFATWKWGSTSYFAAYVNGSREPAGRSIVGICDSSGICKNTHDVFSEIVPGRPAAILFDIPKITIGNPPNGLALESLSAATLESARSFPLTLDEIHRLAVDETDQGTPYLTGVHEFAVTPLLSALSAPPDSANAGSVARPLGNSWISLAGVGVVVIVGFGASLAIVHKRNTQAMPVEKYERIRVLGEGATGTTFLARHRAIGKLVAIKELRPGIQMDPLARMRLVREARLAGSLRHANVVDVYDIEESPERLAIVMEYLEGGSLQQKLDVLGPSARFPPTEAIQTYVSILEGLAAIHDAGVVHRDVKPANILLGTGDVVKIADFGVAQSPAEETLGPGGSPVGTLQYMAPEIMLGAEPLPSCDVYSATLVLYRLTQGPPTHSPLRDAALREKTSAGSTERALREIFIHGLAEDPLDRPKNAGEMLRLARQILDETTTRRPPSLATEPNERRRYGVSETSLDLAQTSGPRLG